MAFMRIFGALLVPALIASAIYLLGAYVLAPLIRRHRERYSQYLPMRSLATTSSSLRERFSDFFSARVVPLFRRRRQVVMGGEADGETIDEEAVVGGGAAANGSSGGRENAFRGSVESDDEAVLFSDDVGDRMAGFGFGNGRRPG